MKNHHGEFLLMPIKRVATINDEALGETTDPDFELRYIDIGNVDSNGNIHEVAAYRFEDAPSRARRIVRDGDLIISTVRTYLQAIAPINNPPENLIVSTGFAVVRPSIKKLDAGFCKYALHEPRFIQEVITRSTGVSYPAITAMDLADIPIFVPPLSEQRAIADYLDRETTRLDSLIAAKERLLELLAEKRRAVITHAVTRGLNADVSLRDSGVEWLGEIPSHWEVRKLKNLAQVSYGVSDELDRGLTSGVPIISLPNVAVDGTLHLEELVWADVSESDKPSLLLKRGDLLFNWRNGSSKDLGKTAYFDSEGEYTHVGFLLRIRFKKNYESHYYHAFLNGLRVTGYFANAKAMVNNTFNQSELENLSVMVPPLDEQKKIVEYINEWTTRIDRLYSMAEKTLNLLHERRASLIAAAVSGQIGVGRN